jgi:hypothetical protein
MPNRSSFSCPVCGFPELTDPPYDEKGCASFDICPSCGTEFGNEDAKRSHADLRHSWLTAGAPWWSKARKPPMGWDAREQLRKAGLIQGVR